MLKLNSNYWCYYWSLFVLVALLVANMHTYNLKNVIKMASVVHHALS